MARVLQEHMNDDVIHHAARAPNLAFSAPSTERSTERVIEDGVMFVRARRALPAGVEVTTVRMPHMTLAPR